MDATSAESGDLDRQRLGAWFEAYHTELLRYLMRLTGDEQLAADVLQETFLRALVALPRVGTPENPPAWLHRIATNLALTALKRRSRWRWFRLSDTEPAPRQGTDIATADLVRRCLLQMRPADVEALLLYEWVGFSCAEIAALHGEAAATVRVRLSRARARFTQWYEREVRDAL
jgi:RNA polymerase sigma-70 factor, ECF subfamily